MLLIAGHGLTYSIIPILAVARHGFKLATRIAVRDGGL
jgi:hypothetical protein